LERASIGHVHIIVASKEKGQDIVQKLKSQSEFNCGFIHSDTPDGDREKIAGSWQKGELTLLVSTTCGLLGNQNDSCRSVVVVGLLYDLSNVVQAIGRLREHNRSKGDATFQIFINKCEWFYRKQPAQVSTAQKLEVLGKMNIGSTLDARKEVETTFSEIGLRQWLNTDHCLKQSLRQVFGYFCVDCGSCTNCLNSIWNKPTLGKMLKTEIAATPNAVCDGRRNLVTPGVPLPLSIAGAPATPLATPAVNRRVNPYSRPRPRHTPKRKFDETLPKQNPIVVNAKINVIQQQQSIDKREIAECFLQSLADRCRVCSSRTCDGGCVSRKNHLCTNCFSRGHFRKQCPAPITKVLGQKGCFRCWRPRGNCKDAASCKKVGFRLKALFYLTAKAVNRTPLSLVETIYNHDELWCDEISKIASKY
jgi:hypothetical protein